jgi:hypothetical protein
MTVGLELACWAGAGTADANATKNKGRMLASLHFIRTSCFEELPNSPRLLRTMPPRLLAFGPGVSCPVGGAKEFNERTSQAGWKPRWAKKVASDTNFSRSHRKSQLLVIAVLVQVTFTPGMIPGVSSNTWELNHNWDTHQVAALLEFRSCWGKTLFISSTVIAGHFQ